MIPGSSRYGWIPAFTGAYDDSEIRLLSAFLEPKSFALDVGACVGFYAVPLGVAARQRGALLAAFEPGEANARVLKTNIKLDGQSGTVWVGEMALGSGTGTATLHLAETDVGNAAIEDPRRAASVPGPAAVVPILPLDEVSFPETFADRPCSVMKMDVEGVEMSVLAGGEMFIGRHRPVIFGEFSRGWFRMRHLPADEPAPWALRHAYLCLELVARRRSRLGDRFELTAHLYAGERARRSNTVLLIPKEREDLVERIRIDTLEFR